MVPWSKAGGHQGGVGAAGWCLHRLPHSMWGRAKRLPVGLVAAPCAEQERRVAASRCSRKDGGQCSGLPTQTACARCARRVGEPEHRQEHSSTPFSIYTIHERQTRQTKTYDPMRMLLTGIWRSRTKYPMKPITANPIAVADAILVNSRRSGLVHRRSRRAESIENSCSGPATDWTASMTQGDRGRAGREREGGG